MFKAITTLMLCWVCFVQAAAPSISFFIRPTAASSTLNTSLIAYWKLGETGSADRVDEYGSNDLSAVNTPSSATGLIGDGVDLEASSSQYLQITDNTDLSFGDEDFTIAAWVKLETAGVSPQNIISKYTTTGNQREYRLTQGLGGNQFSFIITSAGTSATIATVNATSFGAASTATWYLVIAWHDATSNVIGIQVMNSGSANTTAHSSGVFDGTSNFMIGNRDSSGEYLDGVVDEAAVWGKLLSSDEKTELYNSGSGKTCCPF